VSLSDDDKTKVWDDFEECWDAIRRETPIRLVKNRASDLHEQLEIACAKTAFELAGFVKQFDHQALDSTVIAKIVAKSTTIFMEKWREGLKGQNLTGLIEIVLESQDLSTTEMKGFLQALPSSLVQRILDSAIGAGDASGVHALIALESTMRVRGIKDYTIGKTDGRISVEFLDPTHSKLVKFFLDEAFSV
jgi:hypothetical protein